MSRYAFLFTFMAQRDDAQAAGDEDEANYWRGYIDATADLEGLTDELGEAEAAYQEAQAWAAATMP